MNEKIINVYYGQDLLPYKDVERVVHYPITGSAFLGASNTTKIRFYIDQIGDENTTWVSVAKLPNGKQGSKVLPIASDENTTWVSVAKLPNGKQGSKVLPIASDENGNYAELELSNWYTQAKGDVYIALQGYQGGVEYSYDSETELYEIHGTPTIQTTGSIKLAINYAPIGQVADYNDEFTTYQEILAALGDKANVDNVYNKTEVNSALDTKVDKKTTTGTYVYTHNGATQGEEVYTPNVVSNSVVQRDSNGEINVPNNPSGNNKATSKSYVDDTLTSGLATKQDRLVSGTNIKTLTVDGVEKSLLGSGTIEVGTGGSSVEVDDELSTTSTNPVENRVITNELHNVRAELLGKSNSLSLSYAQVLPTSSDVAQFTKFDGTNFTDMTDFNDYVSGLTFKNSDFNDNEEFVWFGSNFYLIDSNLRVVRETDIRSNFKVGQFNIYITERGIPDRWLTWVASNSMAFYSLETEKVNLTGYATKTELSESIKNLAQPYDSDTIYSIGDKTIHDNKLYSCLVNMSAAESWDATHWLQITVASGFVDLDKAQVISGQKKISNSLLPSSDNACSLGASNIRFANVYTGHIVNNYSSLHLETSTDLNVTVGANCSLKPSRNNYADLGNSTIAWKDLYLSGTAYVSTGVETNSIGTGNTVTGVVYLKVNGNNKISFNNFSFSPIDNNSLDLGTSSLAWKDGYFSGQVYAQNTFNVINATDIVNNTLTQAQYDLITNGKPTLIVGATPNDNYLLLTYHDYIGYIHCLSFYRNSFSNIEIIKTTLAVNWNYGNETNGIGITDGKIIIRKLANVNGKSIPAYPTTNTSPQVLTIGANGGNLSWENHMTEWYGTQAQYDALGTYDSNTTYNIIED